LFIYDYDMWPEILKWCLICLFYVHTP
jgi:hypothetical protein